MEHKCSDQQNKRQDKIAPVNTSSEDRIDIAANSHCQTLPKQVHRREILRQNNKEKNRPKSTV